MRLRLGFALLASCVFLLTAFPAANAQSAGQELPLPTTAPAPDYAWAPELLYGIISSSSPTALDSLYDAAFAAGPAIVPQLQAALKDDRTAEFAAQSLAFIGGEKAFTILSTLMSDPRNLDLRRFFYGALGELNTPPANAVLLNAVRNANGEPDRTVTEAAIIALTVGDRAALLPQLKQAQAKLTDPVIQDDLENAISVIQTRTKYLSTLTGKNAGGSLQQALNLYFEPALAATAGRSRPTSAPAATVRIQHLTFSPDQTRALASVRFEDVGAKARYQIVLQKRYGNWTVASVWLNEREERAAN